MPEIVAVDWAEAAVTAAKAAQGTPVESIKKCRKLGHLPLKTGENPAKIVVFSELYKKKYGLNEFIIIIKNATTLN